MIKNSCHFHPTLDLSAPKAYNIVNVKTNFVLNVYAAPGACREAADFLSRPFASAGGGYSKRQIYLSFTMALLPKKSKEDTAMNEHETIAALEATTDREKPEIANMDPVDYMTLLMECRIIQAS